jgi:hypothetical protein
VVTQRLNCFYDSSTQPIDRIIYYLSVLGDLCGKVDFYETITKESGKFIRLDY